MSLWEQYLRPAAFTLLPFAGSIPGSFITRSNIKNWYDKDLKKPSWRPPNWAFGPVWTTLYASMGYASYMIWRDGGGFQGEAKTALAMYGTQLALNWAWTPIFFGKKQLGWGMVDIVLMWGSIASCIVLYHPINSDAAHMMLPYLAWVSLASALNFSIWRNNPKPAIKSD